MLSRSYLSASVGAQRNHDIAFIFVLLVGDVRDTVAETGVWTTLCHAGRDMVGTASIQHPFDVDLQVLSVLTGARRDVAWSGKLALGGGCGTNASRVKHPVQHMENFQMILAFAAA